MATYVTAAQIDEEIGPGWAGEGTKGANTKIVNAWLTSIIKRKLSVVPQEVVQAAGLIAPLAASGTLFRSSDVEVLSKSNEAEGVKTSKTFRQGSVARSLEENAAIALLEDVASESFISVARVRLF